MTIKDKHLYGVFGVFTADLVLIFVYVNQGHGWLTQTVTKGDISFNQKIEWSLAFFGGNGLSTGASSSCIDKHQRE